MFKIRFNKKIAFSNNSNLRFSVVRRRFFIFSNHKKGIVLFLVLGTLLVVVSLAALMLSLILSHARLTYHQTSRIQAYYAAMAGINYGLEKLRTGTWVPGTIPTGCSGSSTSYTCTMSFDTGDFKPASIVGNNVSIIIRSVQSSNSAQPWYFYYIPPGSSACVSTTATYYNP